VLVNGSFQGAGTVCGNCAAPYAEVNDAGELPATAAIPSGSGALNFITGSIITNGTTGDADMYQIQICDRTKFNAALLNTVTNPLDTQLFLFDSTGRALVMCDDSPAGIGRGGVIGPEYVPANGTYYIAISAYNKDPVDGSSALMWANTNPTTATYYPEWTPFSNNLHIGGWAATTTATGNYTLALSGVCYPGAACYANCDQSTNPPILNANDFQCFLNKYAANDPYANCDNSTNPPILNANDFQCFLNAYAAGCS
jgi:hypothetical protein